MATLSSGDTLSLNNLATATDQSTKSMGTVAGSTATPISMSAFAIDAVGSLSGFTYVVENTSENYTLGFTSNMSDANYVSATEVGGGTTSDSAERSISGQDGSTARTSSSYRFRHVYHGSTAVKYDDQYNNILHIGDLA